MFFDQLELCVFHAKKAWQKTLKAYQEGDELPWLTFSLAIDSASFSGISEILEKEDPDSVSRQSIAIKIVEP